MASAFYAGPPTENFIHYARSIYSREGIKPLRVKDEDGVKRKKAPGEAYGSFYLYGYIYIDLIGSETVGEQMDNQPARLNGSYEPSERR